MKQRLLVAAIGVPLLIVVLVILPPVAAWILTAAIAAAAAWELLHTAGKHVTPLVYALTMLMAVLTVAYISMDGWWTAVGDRLYFACAYVFVAALFLIAVVTHGKETALPFATVAVCIVGGLLFPAMYSCIALLRNVSPAFVLMPFVIAFIGDSFSMLGGMAFGHKKFAPHVSPNKTWAGFLAGPVGSAAGMVLLGLVAKLVWQMELPLWFLAVIGVVANLFGQLGDLSTSLIKREAGIKDYSHIFLTHGGVLDRFDSTLFIAPVVYAMLFVLEKL
ncbi:MAG: phosphatidate cytidylyltransferase [Oscillospiraceae bacterium]|mgnify:FL=1|jgi:phosphatidate cytidylyltransferase|nr:phosphatidate cytidylyltransferase [Oscillospiraceae bacterium]